MYFADLTPHEYSVFRPILNVLNVGWLDVNTPYRKGKVSNEVLDKLGQIILSEGVFEARLNQLRGIRNCCFCGSSHFRVAYVGRCELWIPAVEPGKLYATPSMVLHYIEDHDYYPPDGFLDSVMRLNLGSPFNAQATHDKISKELSRI